MLFLSIISRTRLSCCPHAARDITAEASVVTVMLPSFGEDNGTDQARDPQHNAHVDEWSFGTSIAVGEVTSDSVPIVDLVAACRLVDC